MFFGTVEIGGMKYSGAPSSTKAEAMQIAASVASSALPPVCASGEGGVGRGGEEREEKGRVVMKGSGREGREREGKRMEGEGREEKGGRGKGSEGGDLE